MKSRNMPDWLVAHLVTIAKLGAAGGFSTENTKPIATSSSASRSRRSKFVEDYKALFV